MQSALDLAPTPDFRYVGLGAAPAVTPALGPLAAVGATVGAGLAYGASARAIAIVFLAASASMVIKARRAKRARFKTIAIVPWGILVDPDVAPRILRWAAIKAVRVDMRYGRDEGTPTTLYSTVTLETEREILAGCATGAAPLDRLLAHLDAYAREQEHTIALDLDGETSADPLEPASELLLSSARAWIGSAAGSRDLDLPTGYRGSLHAPSAHATELLRAVLRDRRARRSDTRAFAAVLAGELGARDLIDDLVALVQSPHPVIAAVAKAAAKKLGVATSRVGALDEVAPFLAHEDAERLGAWAVRHA